MAEETEKRWLSFFVFACPNCGYPKTHSIFPGFDPSVTLLNPPEFPLADCERCHARFQPHAHEAQRATFPLVVKTHWEPHKKGK